MRLIDLDDILKQFPEADFDGDDLENMDAYPHWKTDITGLFNILKSVSIIEPCEDCISREEALKHTHIEYNDDGIGHRVVYAEDIEELPSVTPSIPEVEDNFDIGYNCGYADAVCDIGGEE